MKSFKFPPLLMAVIILVAVFVFFKYGIPPLLPVSLLIQYMIICVIGVLLFFSFDEDTWSRFKAPIAAVTQKDNTWPIRWFFLLAIPALIGYTAHIMVKPDFDSPVELRQVHPAPPSKLKVFNKTYDLSSLENPVREKVIASMKAGNKDDGWETYNTAVSAGRDIYYQNCFFCHGDLMYGEGIFADGFNPRPINFQDETINQLQEAFLFWRITTGGPGLPKEGTPWKSAMPVWHEMLGEEDVWNVITFLYDYTEEVPRIWDAEISKIVTGMKTELSSKRAKMKGKELYDLRCSVCHGEEGAGDGVAADTLYPRPRDFTLGLFKYKTSPGTLPVRDEDLFDTIKHGLSGTGMPGWSKLMTDEQINSLIPVLKRFDISATWAPDAAEDDDFDDEGHYKKDDFKNVTEIEPLDGQIAYSADSAAKGKKAFKPCYECHGVEGRGDLRSGKRLADDWGYRIWPRDLNKAWSWRTTNRTAEKEPEKVRDQIIKNIYTRLSIGIPGTPMPAHRAEGEGNEDPVSLEDRWHIANYVYSLRDINTAPGKGVIQGVKVEGNLPDTIADEAWKTAPVTSMRLVPNIIKEPRMFKPLNDLISVRVLYNEDEIAFLMEVNDRTHSLPGHEYSMSIQDEELTLHSDAVAMQFPREGAYTSAPMVEKPLYRHGDSSHNTSMWYWNAGSLKPKQAASSMVLKGSGPNTKPEPMMDYKEVSAQGEWFDGRWQILMKRKRAGTEGEISFNEGEFIPVSFANWDGSNGEAGSKHTLSTWYWLLLPPESDPVKLYVYPAGFALLMFIIGLLVVRGQRSLYKETNQ
ncbi:MAG: c-type cytochrome [gamma proteobacterium symbiont of Taylorina sp.]|nr:c-type cytochrome [gamma proteobacterium symbiont of Taylorina sp.]